MSEEKKYRYAHRAFHSTALGRILKRMRKRYEAEEEQESKFLVGPYILTCAAYLEAKLNDSLQEFALERYGDAVADAYMSLHLPTKLRVLVPLLTDGRYGINTNHFVYQRLLSLIRARNAIAHAQAKLEEIPVSGEDDLVDTPLLCGGMIRRPRQSVGNEADVTLGVTKTFTCLEYHDALDKLEKWFFHRCPDRLSKVAMVVERSKDKEWKLAGVEYVKYLDDEDPLRPTGK